MSSCRGASIVHVQDVQPRSVAVALDSTFQRVVPVRAVVRLRPARATCSGAIAVVPGTVRLLGPRDAHSGDRLARAPSRSR